MRIVQVCPTYYPHIGGIPTHVDNISKQLVKKYDVTVFTTDPSGKLPTEEKLNGVRVKRFRSFAPNNSYYFSLEMFKELRKAKFDIVHAHGYRAFPMFFGALAKNVSKAKFVITTHLGFSKVGRLPYLFYNPIFGRLICEKADKIIIVSPSEPVELPILRKYIKKVSLIPNGVDFSRFSKAIIHNNSKDTLNLLYVGRVERQKGIHYIIKAVSKLRGIPIHLSIVGEGPYMKELRKIVYRNKLNSNVSFKGKISREELLDTYSNSNIFLLLSEFEAHSVALTEAMVFGLVPIVSNVGGNPYIVDKNVGFRLDFPININNLAFMIRMLYDDRTLLMTLGKKARKKALEKFDINTTVDRLIQVYRSISC